MTRRSRGEKLGRVIELRTAALAVLERQGCWATFQSFPHPVRSFEGSGFSMIYRTPLQPVPTVAALGHVGMAGDFGLDIWKGRKVLSLCWEEDSAAPIEIVAFVRGAWEEELSSLAAAEGAEALGAPRE